ncbi:hypothetical protein KEM55_002271, partial [Ascosphaera atra]
MCEAEDEDEDEDEDMDLSEDEEEGVDSRGQHFSHHFFNVIAPFRYAQILMEAVKSPAEGPFFKAILNIEEIDPKDIDGIPGNARTFRFFERLHQAEDSHTGSDMSTPDAPRLHPELQVAEAIQTLPSIPGMDSLISTSRPVCRACEALFRPGEAQHGACARNPLVYSVHIRGRASQAQAQAQTQHTPSPIAPSTTTMPSPGLTSPASIPSIPHYQYEGQEHFSRLLDSVAAGRDPKWDITFILTEVDEQAARSTPVDKLIKEFDPTAREALVRMSGPFHEHFKGAWQSLFIKKILEAGLWDLIHTGGKLAAHVPSEHWREIRCDLAHGPKLADGLPFHFTVEVEASQGFEGRHGQKEKAFTWLFRSNAPVRLVMTADLGDELIILKLLAKGKGENGGQEEEEMICVGETCVARLGGAASATSSLTIPINWGVLGMGNEEHIASAQSARESPDFVTIEEEEIEELARLAWRGA